ncbi:MAG: 16S rRNA (adenine(1518)-N(6)/adenine(1519)-N(6))-dimethyltransferase RsmA [Acidobacteriota bacterium]|nr:16S rRNA (adenine(1518)-N(6)/adenine(1519)-N(6))-dimethyltransferase RsmA [Acidobacteriota bacterium]
MKEKRKSKTPSVYAKKSFGQNFLIDPNYIEKIISSLNIRAGETIIEIGPGRGALTRKLIERKARVFAVELDKDLIPILETEFGNDENFVLIEGDALKLDFRQFVNSKQERIKLVANLPYYISTAILQKLIEQREVFSELVLMLQREVVERIAAPAGNSERGFLSVLVEAYCQVEKLFDVPPAAFKPIPKVWSAVIILKMKELGLITKDEADEKLFWALVSAGFAQKRKTILNNLKNARSDLLLKQITQRKGIEEILIAAQIEKSRRAETLTLEDWKNIFAAIYNL